jgi:hypothetical protein
MSGAAAGRPAWAGFAFAILAEAAWLAALAWMAWGH